MPEIRRRRPGYIRLLTLVIAGVSGPLSLLAFGQSDPHPVPVAAGVVTRHYGSNVNGVRVIDVDLAQPGTKVRVAAEEIAVRRGRITGRSRRLEDWLQSTGAVAGINGGFFGSMVDRDHKEIVGLLKLDGRVRAAAPTYHSSSTGKDYARSSVGFSEMGTPRMAWVTSAPGNPQRLRQHATAEFATGGSAWPAHEALQCGPRLIHNGRIATAERAERLVSRGSLPRTFLGFGGPEGKPRFMVLCAADGMEFLDCARFLKDYFQREHHCACEEAMCLDGGASTQASWREGGAIRSDPDPHTSVPTALLVYAGK